MKPVAGTVRDTIRISDQIFRYGGEEYVVILSRVNAKTATQLAEKICRQVEKDYFVDGDKKFVESLVKRASDTGSDTGSVQQMIKDTSLFQSLTGSATATASVALGITSGLQKILL